MTRVFNNATRFGVRNCLVKNFVNLSTVLARREHQSDISRTEGRCRKRWERVFPEGSYDSLSHNTRLLLYRHSRGSSLSPGRSFYVAGKRRAGQRARVGGWKFLIGASYPVRALGQLNGAVRMCLPFCRN